MEMQTGIFCGGADTIRTDFAKEVKALRVIAVVEEDKGPVRAALEEVLRGKARVVAPGERPPPYDVVVWERGGKKPVPPLCTRALVVRGEDAGRALKRCRCEMVLTYGFGVRDTLTPSAILGEGCVLSLQRGLVTLDGEEVEPREVPAGRLTGEAETRMAVAAVCLLLGEAQA